jgi:DNA-binding protein H-NS
MNILEKANEIVNQRSEEKERQYGPFNESMDKMRDIFNAMTGLQLETKHMFLAMVAAKLARECHSHKEDNLLDAAAYIGAMNNYLEKKI